ncbi:MAG: PA2817 family protein [Pseudomonadota bacterium]
MNDEQYRDHNIALFKSFSDTFCQRTQTLAEDDRLRMLALEFQSLAKGARDQLYDQGAALTVRLFTTHPEFAPTYPRELLWFFGGDCLHFMPDEEIGIYQQLEEQRLQSDARGKLFDFQAARAKLLNLQ